MKQVDYSKTLLAEVSHVVMSGFISLDALMSHYFVRLPSPNVFHTLNKTKKHRAEGRLYCW